MIKPRIVITCVATVAILALVYWPVFRWLVNSWLSNEFYSHGFLVPLVSGFFVWTRREYLQKREPSIIGAFFLVPGALLYGLSFLWEIRVLGVLSLIIVLTGLVFSFFGTRTARAMLFPLVFLVFMIPLPFISNVAYRLQEISIYSSSRLLDALGLPVASAGSEIYLENTPFIIGLPCSGINTFVALLALAAVYAYILTGSIYRRLSLFILAFPMAIVANILRITTIIMVAYYFSIETATGWYHNLSSPLFFAVAFLVLVLVGRIMKCRINYELLRRK